MESCATYFASELRISRITVVSCNFFVGEGQLWRKTEEGKDRPLLAESRSSLALQIGYTPMKSTSAHYRYAVDSIDVRGNSQM